MMRKDEMSDIGTVEVIDHSDPHDVRSSTNYTGIIEVLCDSRIIDCLQAGEVIAWDEKSDNGSVIIKGWDGLIKRRNIERLILRDKKDPLNMARVVTCCYRHDLEAIRKVCLFCLACDAYCGGYRGNCDKDLWYEVM